jgi:preprotein translocase subunit YajC
MQTKSTFSLLLFGLLMGVLLTKLYYTRQNERVVESSVMLEQIKNVTKVITVEGAFSEIMTQNSYDGNFGFFWDKKAIVQVRAKVSAGFDLNKMQITLDEATHTVRLRNRPKAEILSLDPQLSYYDIQEGIFESFTAQDHTRIQADARRKIEEATLRSNLLLSAENQGNTLLNALKTMIEQSGWKVESEFKL